ncbi:MAG: hypothetical protein K9N46_15775 [Candidatus Marinimicrobia bacterium]|nr:hypothetical protein [Candidatus Neomarinimicrobiota bacterium]MCF7830281.1 hypothetical protein [Candidatus Neomarinimicrobiota bacterium]MCF7882190.1 hypothetical protein [Candidatus Neomarinimicrobiota bacterium]
MADQTTSMTDIISEILDDDGTYPNNAKLPTLIYKDPLNSGGSVSARDFESLFDRNDWPSAWRYGIYTFHHYHSTAHEVLGVFRGATQVQLGGPSGIIERVEAGDVIVIPAGVAHKNRGSNSGFRCVGGYANGDSWDMKYGKPDERPMADENIANVNPPVSDPVHGDGGPLMNLWGKNE